MRVTARGPAQDRDALAGDALPVSVERLGSRVEEHEPGVVDRPRGRGVQLGEQRTAELVGGQDVQVLVAHERGRAGDRVEGPLDLGPDALLGRAPTRSRYRRLRGAGEVEEVSALGVVELERPGQCLQHALRDAVHVSALQARVVRHAHAGQDGDLLAAESGNAAIAVGAQPRLLRRDPGAAGGEEVPDLLLGLHAPSVDPALLAWETLPVPLSTGTPSFARSAVC